MPNSFQIACTSLYSHHQCMKVVVFFKKSLLNSLQHCSCFLILVFGREACGILVPQLGFETLPCAAPPHPSPCKVKSQRLDHQGSPCMIASYQNLFLTNTFYFSSSDRYIVVLHFNVIYLFIYFWLCCRACGIFVPWPGFKLRPLTVRVHSPKHWTIRALPHFDFDMYFIMIN